MINKDLYISKCRPNAVIPTYANKGDAGMDLYSCIDIDVNPGQTVLVPVGLKMAIPEGYEVQIRPRSGISLKTMLRIPNSPGTIDCGYRDEINVIIHNASQVLLCEKDSTDNFLRYDLSTKGAPHGIYSIKKGDRIAQMVFARVETTNIVEVSTVDDIGTSRGGGFGSSGIQ